VAILCALAAARVFFGAAALPFFADTDEQAHFDLVHKFARGHWPAEQEVLKDPETVDRTILDGSLEFTDPPNRMPDERLRRPVRDWPDVPGKKFFVNDLRAFIGKAPTHEAHSPPVYYALAGGWYDLGRALGLSGPHAVYWVRFLNVPLYAALVACAYGFCRPYFGRDTALAAAALTALFPNTVFFTINSDVPSPLLACLAALLVLRWYEREKPGPGLSAGAGAAAAAAVLVKLTNAAVLVLVAAVVLLRFRRDGRARETLRATWPLLLAAALPLFLWGLRNRLVLGDWTATAAKVRTLTWTPKPWGELLHHPLFTPDGLTAFLTRLVASFFDGDANWNGHAARSPVADALFLAGSAFLPAAGFVAALLRGRREPRLRLGAGASALLVAAFFGVLVALSLRFDFGDCPYPSREFPFFTSGRLIAGALVPFLALYAFGLETLLGRWPALFVGAVAVTLAMMVVAQLAFVQPTVASPYNWFHLP
jgi:4-amino-4-deoxy-L-arabinose transferase-like glycosyltransferase